MRVFAGPNGSGKSMMYGEVRSTKVNGRSIDLGVYVNPDEIAKELREKGRFTFADYEVDATGPQFTRFALTSGLLPTAQDAHWLSIAVRLNNGQLELHRAQDAERIAQLLAQYLVDRLLTEKKKVSFETVFSHPSKVKVMEKANQLGYKMYLYFIATNHPEINKDRVRTRIARGGHSVPPDRIEGRYYRSLENLLPALRQCYHAFLFDNSGPPGTQKMFAELKVPDDRPTWWLDYPSIPQWFKLYYLDLERGKNMSDALNKAVITWAIRSNE